MNITAEDLIKIVDEARKEIMIVVRSTDFYSRPGDLDEEYLEYVCPQLLMSNLQHFIEANEK